ncbi:helix-turn-helix transcriptional regulator [Tumebacillus sp. ITR2]|uniref:Helix-turn-helix transcriptional regulator n=1 Tax=Tumebacillus amylolyticus TaxID=2801339 RepID=A0ABS1JEY5_9BACL|nr:helix-turn-helix transcriptional regulator [Tumebacillus amylolyticus]MBL0388803.1 helix-turn-helix transcriptional regulator [Tumebacillus amylolyticus]
MNKELLKGSTAILVLSLLEKQDLYGYQMIKAMEQASNGLFLFKEGTLYPLLHTLESNGDVESYWSDGEGARKRKYYRLTEAGRLQVRKKREEWQTFRNAVDLVIGEGNA